MMTTMMMCDGLMKMVSLYEEAQREGKGVALKNGKFVGPPMYGMAMNILNKKKLIESKQ